MSRCPADYNCQTDDVQPDYAGVAPGAANAHADGEPSEYVPSHGYRTLAWSLGIAQSGTLGPLSGAPERAHVIDYSYTDVPAGDPVFDALANQRGVLTAIGAGNNGPAPGSTDCGTYDALCVGAIDPVSILDHTDDVIADFSGRGPTPDGRKKPDLVAVGVTQAARSTWKTSGLGLWRNVSGTSYSTPQVAGAAALLMGAGISDPMAIRALLIDSARRGRSTSSDPMGWDPLESTCRHASLSIL